MAAHIAVVLRASVCGDPIRTLEPRSADVGEVMPGFDNLEFPALRLVDPYGQTIFNGYQMAGLIPELQRLHEQTHDPILAQVIELAEQARRSGGYLVFMGD